jgi:dTDP-4-amino-4,6-dideoxygalactose transaminase
MKYRPHAMAIHLANASLKRLHQLNSRCEQRWHWVCEEIDGVKGIRPQYTLPSSVRGGYMSFVFVYDGEGMGGPSRKQFVSAVQAEGAPLSEDRYSEINYTYGLLHQAPLFTSFDPRSLGGGCFDPTRSWAETNRVISLPTCERLARQLVSFPRFEKESEKFVRSCGRALRRVLVSLVTQSAETSAYHLEQTNRLALSNHR